VPFNPFRDRSYERVRQTHTAQGRAVSLDAEAPLFILYTSGTTGTPKGVVHTQAGYLLYAAMTFRYVFDYDDKDIFWCTADVGWITGHSYALYGPLSQGATLFWYEGVPTYPNAARYWTLIDQYQVTVFYTAPTVLRQLKAQGDAPLKSSTRKSLRLLGSVGEPINPEVWTWYHDVVGNRHCPVVDTWWQTETGGILLAPLVHVVTPKVACVGVPFFGIQPGLVDENGALQPAGQASGNLVVCQAWPGIARSLYGNHARWLDTYFAPVPGCYSTGDGAERSKDGEYLVTGRTDDVLNPSGHRIGACEFESAIMTCSSVAEVAVVAMPDTITGEAACAFVCLKPTQKPSDALKKEIESVVMQQIGRFAKVARIVWGEALPRTRSGKIMRRLLKAIASGQYDALGDVST
ncbi:MAG: AMP-binding protein, partial [Pseudomonadota bacterium]